MHDAVKQNSCRRQGPIRPVSLGGAISVIFDSQFSLRVHYCKRNEI